GGWGSIMEGARNGCARASPRRSSPPARTAIPGWERPGTRASPLGSSPCPCGREPPRLPPGGGRAGAVELLWGGRFRDPVPIGRPSMDFRTIHCEQLGAVVRLTANRPAALHAQRRVMILELDSAFRHAAEDDQTRVVIVAGAGTHFSAGHDLGSPEELEDQKAHPVGPGFPENLKRLSELYLETCLRWRDVPKPTI